MAQVAMTGSHHNFLATADRGYCVNCHNLGELGVRCGECWRAVPLKTNSAGVELINWYQRRYHCVFVKAGFRRSELIMTEMPCEGVLRQPEREVSFFFLIKKFFMN